MNDRWITPNSHLFCSRSPIAIRGGDTAPRLEKAMVFYQKL